MNNEKAKCDSFSEFLNQAGRMLDQLLQFRHSDALKDQNTWQSVLNKTLPTIGVGIDKVMSDFSDTVVPNGSPISKPGFTGYITTGPTTVGVVAQTLAAVAGTQRIGHTSFSFLEQLSLCWLKELFGLPQEMQGIYSSGGSTANLIAMGVARQSAFEKIGIDYSQDGCHVPSRIYATELCHKTIDRAAAVLGLGRAAVVIIEHDRKGRMAPIALRDRIKKDIENGLVPVAVVCNAGATSTGIVDPIQQILEIANQFGVWLHVDGAYGLPGLLDSRKSHLFEGIEQADSIIVDIHKWLGAPVGIGTTFVKDAALLQRAFGQGHADYLEGSNHSGGIQHSMHDLGIPYTDFGVELSAPSRGAVVWALLSEIGKKGLEQRITRHIDMAKWLANEVTSNENLELLQEPTLSICCFRFNDGQHKNLNALNKEIHNQLLLLNVNLPSTTMIDGKLAIRPCFIGARTSYKQAQTLLSEVSRLGQELMSCDSYKRLNG